MAHPKATPQQPSCFGMASPSEASARLALLVSFALGSVALAGGCTSNQCADDPSSVFCRGLFDNQLVSDPTRPGTPPTTTPPGNGGTDSGDNEPGDGNGNGDGTGNPTDCTEEEPGALCDSEGLRCSTVQTCTCGNGEVDPGELCDDADNPKCQPDCSLACTAPTECPTSECRQAPTCDGERCALGAPTPAGRTCSAGICDGQGECVSCDDAGDSCTPPGACGIGIIRCQNGRPACVPTGPAAAGTPCGQRGTCSAAGECLDCGREGEACAPLNACFAGRITCDAQGIPACVATEPKPAGDACPTGVCSGSGECIECNDAGAECAPTNDCMAGVISCTPSGAVCGETHAKPSGSPCGTGGVCNGAGACQPCALAGQACDTGNPCSKGVYTCNGSQSVCTPTANQPHGTSCGGAAICDGTGACISPHIAQCVQHAFGGRRYLICNERRDWGSAAAFCQQNGYQLLRIDNAAEQAHFSRRDNQGGFVGHGPGGAFWMGGSDHAQEGIWRWIDNNDVFTFCPTHQPGSCTPQHGLFTAWNRGEPNNRGNEDCLQMRENFGQVGWNDVQCHTKSRFVCKR